MRRATLVLGVIKISVELCASISLFNRGGKAHALGAIANAPEVNNKAAETVIHSTIFFKVSDVLIHYLAWLNLVWVAPMLFWWRKTTRNKSVVV